MKKILAVSLIFFSVALSIFALTSSSSKSALKGSKPSWASSSNYVKAADATTKLGFRVYLGWTNQSGAEALARSVSNPRSSSYRHYLTPAQFRQQFAPTANQVAQVQSWLTSQGFSLVYTPANNHYVSAQGTVAQAKAAFGTSFGMYKVKGLTLRSPAADVSIPSSLAGVVNAVVGLDQSYEFIHPNHVVDGKAPPSAGFRNSPPLSAFWAELLTGIPVPPYTPPPAPPGYAFPTGFTDVPLPSVPWSVKGHTPTQVKGAYSISGYTGTGQTVAIIDAYASPTILQDANQWSTNRGIPQFGTAGGGTFTQVVAPGTYNVKDNPAQGPTGWYGEETLDVESVHGMAPNAHVVYVGAPNNYQDLDAAMNHVVDNHLAQIVSNSYGFLGENLPPGYIKPLNDTFIQAAIEGIGIYFSSGDSGDETINLGFASTDWPASSPWVTAVGGTALGVSSGNTRVVETGWGTSSYACDKTTLVCTLQFWLYGAGGGESKIFAKPSYQTTYGGNLTGFTGRGVPDIAALADPNAGYLVGQTQTFPPTCNGPGGVSYDEYRIGGTSLSCPIIAGIMALSDQKAGFAHGFANPFFYANPSKFTDITSTNTAVARRNFNNGVDACSGTADRLRTFNDYSGSPTQHTGTGWDNVTGLGVPAGIP
ncbi:MAG: serine protease [Verrucomicrobia bacterium]|nr:MAG: serine protease [Verrucomicrobiota bacterium]